MIFQYYLMMEQHYLKYINTQSKKIITKLHANMYKKNYSIFAIKPIQFFTFFWKLCHQYTFEWKMYKKIFICFVKISCLDFDQVESQLSKNQSYFIIEASGQFFNRIIKELLYILFQKSTKTSINQFFISFIEQQLEQRYPIDFLLCIFSCETNLIKWPKYFIDDFLLRFLQLCENVYHLHQKTQQIKIKLGIIDSSNVIKQVCKQSQCCRTGKKAILINCNFFAKIVQNMCIWSFKLFNQCLARKEYQNCLIMVKNCKELFDVLMEQKWLKQTITDDQIQIQIIAPSCIHYWNKLNEQTRLKSTKFLKKFTTKKQIIREQKWFENVITIISFENQSIISEKQLQEVLKFQPKQKCKQLLNLQMKIFQSNPQFCNKFLKRILLMNEQPTLKLSNKLNQICYEIQQSQNIENLIKYAWKQLGKNKFPQKFAEIISKLIYQQQNYNYLQHLAINDQQYKTSLKSLQLISAQIEKRRRKQLGTLSKLNQLKKQVQIKSRKIRSTNLVR